MKKYVLSIDGQSFIHEHAIADAFGSSKEEVRKLVVNFKASRYNLKTTRYICTLQSDGDDSFINSFTEDGFMGLLKYNEESQQRILDDENVINEILDQFQMIELPAQAAIVFNIISKLDESDYLTIKDFCALTDLNYLKVAGTVVDFNLEAYIELHKNGGCLMLSRSAMERILYIHDNEILEDVRQMRTSQTTNSSFVFSPDKNIIV